MRHTREHEARIVPELRHVLDAGMEPFDGDLGALGELAHLPHALLEDSAGTLRGPAAFITGHVLVVAVEVRSKEVKGSHAEPTAGTTLDRLSGLFRDHPRSPRLAGRQRPLLDSESDGAWRDPRTLRILLNADHGTILPKSVGICHTARSWLGQRVRQLRHEIGNYTGQVPINLSETPAALRVEADGEWTIAFSHLSEAPRWDGSGTYEASGDSIVIVDEVADGLTPVTLTHSGDSNFAIWAWGESYPDLIVNDVGTYDGTTLLPDGSLMLQVTADGDWSIAKN